jgi:Replication-relaxation
MSAPASVADRAALAGQDLYPGTQLNQGRRVRLARRVRLTERDLRLLALLLDVGFLSMSQLVMLGWGPYGERAGQRRLKLLHDVGCVDRFRSPRAAGSSEWSYRLAARGFEELAGVQMAASSPRYEPPPATDVSHVQHDLELAALIVRIALDVVGDPSAPLLAGMPFQWHGRRSARIAAIASGRFEPSEAANLPPRTRLHPQNSRRGSLKPDATLIGGARGNEFAALIEYDHSYRAHKRVGRLRRYDAWLLDGWRHTHFATHAIAPAVFLLTVYEGLVGPLIQTADRVLSAWHGREDAGPREGIYPARERILFTSRERLLSGDWTVQRAPKLPPALRDDPHVCSPRSLIYDLPALLSSSRLHPSAAPRTCADGAVASRALSGA